MQLYLNIPPEKECTFHNSFGPNIHYVQALGPNFNLCFVKWKITYWRGENYQDCAHTSTAIQYDGELLFQHSVSTFLERFSLWDLFDQTQYPGTQSAVQSVVSASCKSWLGGRRRTFWLEVLVTSVFHFISQKTCHLLSRSFPEAPCSPWLGFDRQDMLLCNISHSFISNLHILPPAHISAFNV